MHSSAPTTFNEWKKTAEAGLDPDIQHAKAARTFPDQKVSAALAKEHIHARKLWTDAVSKINTLNAKDSKRCQEAVISRIKKFGHQNAEEILHKLIKYLQEKTAIVVGFKAAFLKKGLTSYQLENFYEKRPDKGETYPATREATEQRLFESTPNGQHFLKNLHARPRYGAFILLDNQHTIKSVSWYGSSFLLLKHSMKFNCLFAPSDTLNSHKKSKDYRLCTFHYFEILLEQCSDAKLQSLINWVTRGTLLSTGYDPTYGSYEGYLETLLPAINFFDNNMVEHIHLDDSYVLTESEQHAFIEMGIPLSVYSNPFLNKKAPEVKWEWKPAKSTPKAETKAAPRIEEKKAITDLDFAAENRADIARLEKSFSKSIAANNSKDSIVLSHVQRITELFAKLKNGERIDTIQILLGAIIQASETATCLQSVLKAFHIEKDSEYKSTCLAIFLSVEETLLLTPLTASKIKAAEIKTETKAVKTETKEIKKEVKVIPKDKTLQELKADFLEKIKSYKPGPKRLESINRINTLFSELEAKKIVHAERIILGCWVNEKNIAKSDHKPRLFKQLSELEEKLTDLLKVNKIDTNDKEGTMVEHYLIYCSERFTLKY